jgi:hypothetical protein
MKIRTYFSTGLTIGSLIFSSSLAVAQAAQSSETKKPSVSTAAVTTTSSTQKPPAPAEVKKHIAGVKYEDRTAVPSNDAQSGLLDAKGIQEKGPSAKPAGATTPNEMAIKENGLSSKPAAKPHQ